MEIIKNPRKNIALLWKSPRPLQAVYRPMKYLLKAQTDDGILLYNIITSEMVLLNDNEGRIIEGTPGRYVPEMNDLIAGHYLVTENFDESKSVRELRALLKKIEPSKRVNGFTILPTTECNARCYYCFESDHKRCTMTSQLADDVIEYITRKCNGKPIEIGWFGGEPLVGSKRISQICEGLKQRDIKFRSSMVTNAYLFDEDLIRTAKDLWKMTNVQITLDGTEKVYNETKAYIAPKDNPFRRVLQNIESLLNYGIAVNVRLNVTDKNVLDLSNLIDLLSNKFGDEKGFSCYSHAVYEGVGFAPIKYDETQDSIDSLTVFLDTKLKEKGLLGSLARLPYLRIVNCMSDNDACRLIYPDGTIGKCENKSSDECIGDIYNDITNLEMDEQYKASEYYYECTSCSLYPYCINLKICPETGRCSGVRLDWKKKRYISLMKQAYLKKKQAQIELNVENDNKVECES